MELSRHHPAEWNELLADPEVLVIDNRNTYEIEHGTFQNAINPNTENFRDFPAYIQAGRKISYFLHHLEIPIHLT